MTSLSKAWQAGIQHNVTFLIVWNLANVLPWLVVGLLYRSIFPVAGLAWLIVCLLVGIAQWFVLQQRISGLNQWAIATLIGGTIGLSGFVTYILSVFVVPLACGLSVGVAQWLVLRRKLTGAFWWIVATTGGAALGLGAAFVLPITFFPSSQEDSISATVLNFGLMIEIVSSVVTGGVMLWLLQRNTNRKSVINQSNDG